VADGVASVVCLLDVIEHLADPRRALAEARRLLSSQGRLVVTVPAHPNLWSAADEVLGHHRRYTARALQSELESQGLTVLWSSHIFSWLVAPVWLKRRLRPGGGPELGLDVVSPSVDRAALLLTRLERAVISRTSLPVGTSILCVAERAG